ncbi:MAG: hypothetical protein ABI182_05780 [Candidatus Baltobacteraceae bacterium]
MKWAVAIILALSFAVGFGGIGAFAQTVPSPEPTASAPPTPPILATPPPLTVAPASLDLNPQQLRTVTVSNATGPIIATIQPAIAQVTVDQSSGIITLLAQNQTGSATLHVVDSTGATADIPMKIAFNAGTPPASAVTIKLTGNTLDATYIAAQVKAALTRQTSLQPGAQLAVGAIPGVQLVPGASSAFAVPVQISGGDQYFDVNQAVNVNVQNTAVSAFAPPRLFYDDDPEKINGDGVLYRGTVQPNTPTRLYYYHQNGSDPRRLVVMLTTTSQDPSEVQLIDSSAGPNIDVLTVGHAVTRNFLVMKPNNQGAIFDVPQSTPLVVQDVAMTDGQGAAGNIDLQVLMGGPITVTVMAVASGVDPAVLVNAPQLPDDGHNRTGVFSIANYGQLTLAYTVGGPDAQTVYADREPSPPNVDPGAPGHDYGDYGVLHQIAFDMSNPSGQPATIYLYEKPIGGVVRSSFVVDGQLVEVGCARVQDHYQIGVPYQLAPGATQSSTVLTMTDGGSNYPLEVGVTTTPPQPTTPPISSPDGCFPKPQPATQQTSPEPSQTETPGPGPSNPPPQS